MFSSGKFQTGYLSAAFAALACSAGAQPQKDAIAIALDLCVETPAAIDDARHALLEHGWQTTETAALVALFNAGMVFDFNIDDPEDTIENAYFKAASTLGNSSLGSDQISVELGDYRFALLGIVEGSPYCVVTGPVALGNAFIKSGGDQRTLLASSIVRQSIASYRNGHMAMIGFVDVPALDARLDTSNFTSQDMAQIRSHLSPVTIQILPMDSDR